MTDSTTQRSTTTPIRYVTLEVDDLAVAEAFYTKAFGLGSTLRLRASAAPTSGFRGFTLSLTVPEPADVDALVGTAVDAGATALKPPEKSLWGYGGAVQAPDGTIWTVASSSKKQSAPATGRIDQTVLQLGVADVAASKAFYVERGLGVAKGFGRKYVELDTGSSAIELSLYKHSGLAKVAGVRPDGTGSHRIAIGCDLGSFTDPDGFGWEAVSG